MKIAAYLFLALSLILPKSCDQEVSTDVMIDAPFTLKLNESATFDDGKSLIKFIAVTEDSRCPQGTQCMWEGQSSMQFSIYKKEAQVDATLTLNNSGKTQENADFDYNDYTISVTQLAPYPGAEDFSKENYTVLLIISKK